MIINRGGATVIINRGGATVIINRGGATVIITRGVRGCVSKLPVLTGCGLTFLMHLVTGK